MDDATFNLYMAESSPIFQDVLIFLRYTGARPCEMANATWDDLDLDRAAITLWKHKTSGKVSRPRVVILHAEVIRLLIRLRLLGRETTHIFVNAWGQKWQNSAICQRLKIIREKHGIPRARTLYGLRHAFGRNAIKAGVDLATLKELMGHTSVLMTQRYADMAGQTDHLRKALERIHG